MADLSVTAGSVQPAEDAVVRYYTAGATITAGQPVYVNSVTGRVHPAAAAAAGSDELARAVGIAVAGGGETQRIGVQVSGDITIGGTCASGLVYIVSGTAGGISPHTDATTPATTELCTVLGVGISTTKIRIGIIYGGRLA